MGGSSSQGQLPAKGTSQGSATRPLTQRPPPRPPAPWGSFHFFPSSRRSPTPRAAPEAPRRCLPPMSLPLPSPPRGERWRRAGPGRPRGKAFPQAGAPSGGRSPWRSRAARRPSPAAAAPPSGCRNGRPRGGA